MRSNGAKFLFHESVCYNSTLLSCYHSPHSLFLTIDPTSIGRESILAACNTFSDYPESKISEFILRHEKYRFDRVHANRSILIKKIFRYSNIYICLYWVLLF